MARAVRSDEAPGACIEVRRLVQSCEDARTHLPRIARYAASRPARATGRMVVAVSARADRVLVLVPDDAGWWLLAFGAMWTEEIVAGRPAWRHVASGVVFREVPGGTFRMGLSEAELAAVRVIGRGGGVEDTLESFFANAGDAQPVREVRVDPFLIARHPLTVAQVQHWLPEYEDDYADVESGTARLEDDLDDLLDALPFRLPSEAEWEYAARAGTTTLTFRGDGKPGEDQLLDDFGDEQRTAAAENAFGLAAMGSANEICADVWIPGFTGAPADARPRTGDGPRAVRGGAADLYPWQGCDEWLLLLAATRYEHAQFTAVRPVAPLPPRN